MCPMYLLSLYLRFKSLKPLFLNTPSLDEMGTFLSYTERPRIAKESTCIWQHMWATHKVQSYSRSKWSVSVCARACARVCTCFHVCVACVHVCLSWQAHSEPWACWASVLCVGYSPNPRVLFLKPMNWWIALSLIDTPITLHFYVFRLRKLMFCSLFIACCLFIYACVSAGVYVTCVGVSEEVRGGHLIPWSGGDG